MSVTRLLLLVLGLLLLFVWFILRPLAERPAPPLGGPPLAPPGTPAPAGRR